MVALALMRHFFILPVKFHYLLTISHKMYILKQKTSIKKKSISKAQGKDEKSEKKNTHKAFGKIV